MTIQAVLFDAGHTLIEPTDEALAEAAAGAQLRATPREIARAFRLAIYRLNQAPPAEEPPNFRVLVTEGLLKLGLDGLDAEEAFWDVLSRHNVERRLWTKAIAGAKPTLLGLRERKLPVGIVSNSDGFVDEYLRHAGLRDQIDFVIDSQIVGVEKPDPRIFQHAIDRLAIVPGNVLFVGDRYDVDVLGARAVGMRAVLYDPTEEDPPGECEVVRRLEDLLQLV